MPPDTLFDSRTETSTSWHPAAAAGAAASARGAIIAAVAFLIASLLTAVPVLLHLYLPLVDLPNHIARLHVAAVAGGPLERYYEYTWSLMPNSAVDLLWGALRFPGEPERFAQLMSAAYPPLLIAATMILARVVHGRWTAWSAGVALVAYNASFFWGFQNYVVSVPFALLGLALWLRLEDRPAARRAALFLPIAAALYLMHLLGFVALAAAAFGRECQRLPAARDRRRAAAEMALSALPFLAVVVWHVVATLTGPPPPFEADIAFGGLESRFETLISPVEAWNLPAFHPINLNGFSILLALAVVFVSLGSRLRLVAFDARLIGPAVALAVLCLITPERLGGATYVHIRFPLILIAVLFAATQPVLSRRSTILVTLIGLVFLGQRAIVSEAVFRAYDAEMRQLRQALEPLPQGARLLGVRRDDRVADVSLWHAPAYAVVWNDAFVPTLFQGAHALTVQPEWSAITTPAGHTPGVRSLLTPDGQRKETLSYLDGWRAQFTHLLLLDGDAAEIAAMPGFREIGRDGRYVLYALPPEG